MIIDLIEVSQVLSSSATGLLADTDYCRDISSDTYEKNEHALRNSRFRHELGGSLCHRETMVVEMAPVVEKDGSERERM